MQSPGHRANLLSADYGEVGLGLALGTPTDRSWGATYTTDFGARADGAAGASVRNTPTRAASRHVASSRSKPSPRKTTKKKAVARAACASSASAGRRGQAGGRAKTCARRPHGRHHVRHR